MTLTAHRDRIRAELDSLRAYRTERVDGWRWRRLVRRLRVGDLWELRRGDELPALTATFYRGRVPHNRFAPRLADFGSTI